MSVSIRPGKRCDKGAGAPYQRLCHGVDIACRPAQHPALQQRELCIGNLSGDYFDRNQRLGDRRPRQPHHDQIQVLTKAGLLSMCAALLAWSYALSRGEQVSGWSRWCAALGIAAGLLPAVFIIFADVRLAPASLMAIFAIHAAWNLAVAAILYIDAYSCGNPTDRP